LVRRAPLAAVRAAVGIAACVASLAAAPARAQQPAPLLPEDPRAPRFEEVERGVYTGFETGWMAVFDTPTADRGKYPFAGEGGGTASGMFVGAHAGVDVGDRLALSAFVAGANLQGSRSYGAFGLFMSGADARLTVWSRRDRNGVERFRGFLHVRGGVALTRPTGLFGTTDLLVAAGPGLEYATRLRHFSLALAADGLWLTRAGAAGLTILPAVRYTF
jgi:hypothetical protein